MKIAVVAAAACLAIGCAQAMVSCPMPSDPLVQMRYVSFFDGDPKEMVELAPDDASAEGQLDLTWQFGPRRPEGVTMVCSYSNSETQRSSVPEGVSLCKLTGSIDASGNIAGMPVLLCQ